MPPIVTFGAPSGTGKTTLLEQVIRRLVAQGHRIGAIKHDAHRLTLDTPGKDSWRLRQAGAWRVIVADSEQVGVFSDLDAPFRLQAAVEQWMPDADLILAEGFRQARFPAFLVRRAAHPPDEQWVPPRNIVAVISDDPDPLDNRPQLSLNDPDAVADFIETRWLAPRSLPALIRYRAEHPPLKDEEKQTLEGMFSSVGEISVRENVRPELGVLGGVMTALIRVDHDRVVFLGPARPVPAKATLMALRDGPRRADVVVTAERSPAVARYRSRCLPVIQTMLRRGERSLDMWWTMVTVASI
ncbi:MAG: molybdopterin-guanine dinucleotide biosynthesis protein B [Myxococcota bacterium]